MDDTDMLHLIKIQKVFFFIFFFEGKLTSDDQYRI